VVEPSRAAEALALYASLGFETRTEPLLADDLAPRCRACLAGVAAPLVIYTRRPNGRVAGIPAGDAERCA